MIRKKVLQPSVFDSEKIPYVKHPLAYRPFNEPHKMCWKMVPDRTQYDLDAEHENPTKSKQDIEMEDVGTTKICAEISLS